MESHALFPIKKQCYTALCLLPWLAICAEGHVGDRVYPVAYLTEEMLAEIQLDDGTVDEWYELIGEPTLTLLDFADPGGKETPDPSDLDFRIWLAWHDDPARFYLGFISSDDVYKNTHDYLDSDVNWGASFRHLMQNHDSITLAIDGDHSAGGGCSSDCPPEELLELHGQTQSYDAIARTVSGPTLDDVGVRYRTGMFAWTVLPPYGEGGGSVAGEAPVISVIELYVTPFDRWGGTWDSPEDIVISDLTADQVIGFAIMVWDFDPSAGGSDFWTFEAISDEGSLLDAIDAILNPRGDFFVDGILLPADPGDSAIQSVSWGRIKASLEVE